jgi:hypothetical protein
MKRLISILDQEVSKETIDPNLYIKEKGEELIVMVAYVDDLIITGNM